MESNAAVLNQFKEHNLDLNKIWSIIKMLLLFIYLFLSTFEVYLGSLFGGVTKYLIAIIIVAYTLDGLISKRFRINAFSILLIIWFSIKCLSIFIGGMNEIIQIHLTSQIGFTMLLFVIASYCFEKRESNLLLLSLWTVSLLFNILSIFFHDSYLVTYKSRQVLTLFGQQNDPNNCAAYSLIGITISLYCIFIKKKYLISCCVACLVGIVALFLTASRGGVLSLIIVFCFCVFTIKPFSATKLFIRAILLFIITMIGVVFLFLFLPQGTIERLFFNSDVGGSGRTDLWASALKLFTTKPIFGAGWGTATYYDKRFPGAVHNTFISMMAENGIVGVSIFLLLFIIAVIRCIKTKKYCGILLVVAAFVCGFFFDSIVKRFFWNSLLIALAVSDSCDNYFSFKLKNNYYEVSV